PQPASASTIMATDTTRVVVVLPYRIRSSPVRRRFVAVKDRDKHQLFPKADSAPPVAAMLVCVTSDQDATFALAHASDARAPDPRCAPRRHDAPTRPPKRETEPTKHIADPI